MFEDFVDIDSIISEDLLDNLDKRAGQAEKNLDRIQKAHEKAGGIFAEASKGGKTLPKSTIKALERSKLERDSTATGEAVKTADRFKGLIGASGAPIKRENLADEVKKQKGLLESLLAGDMGNGQAKDTIDFLRDPYQKTLSFLQKEVPLLAGVGQVVAIADQVIKELTKKGGLLDVTFRYTIDTLKDALRTTIQQMSIQQGFTQLITMTKSGSTSIRDAYNTYNEYNKNNAQFEDTFAIRNTRGI